MNCNKKIRIAAIMDEFTYQCYAPECDIMQVTPDNFAKEIESFQPDMLFIESVWRGKDDLWRFRLHDDTKALVELTSYCRKNKIPVVFWSKEDPVHFGVFIRAASLADFVFTTDADSIELYKAHLGHNRVYYLPFAAQPVLHNPIEEYERKDKFCFAGSFYVKYKERSQTFINLSPIFLEHGLDIYDRNFNKGEAGNNNQSTMVASPIVENYCFPPELQGCIQGGLPYNKISLAYKGYKYGINMTSMVQSGFMFARRAFELLACNTVTVSNYSRGLELFFGDLLIATDDKERMKKLLDTFCDTETNYRKYRLAGLRHVLSEHLYEDRLDLLTRKVLNCTIKKPLPEILVVCLEEDERVRKMFNEQTYERKHLIMGRPEMEINNFSFDYITFFSPNDYYGKNYLTDLGLATRFASDNVIGKAAFYSEGKILHREKTYRRVYEPIKITHQMVAKFLLDEKMKIGELLDFNLEAQILSLDEFNYCENSLECKETDDIEVNTGVPLKKIYEYTDKILPVTLHKSIPFSMEELYNEVEVKNEDFVDKSFSNGIFQLKRESDDDEIVWLRTNKNYEISDFTTGSRIGFFTEILEKTGNVRCQIEYYDENNVKLDFFNFALDGFSLLRISDHAKTFKLIFRMRGKASVNLANIYASSPDALLPAPFPIKDCLLITDTYPNYVEPKKLAKLHKFAKENGLEVLKVGEMPSYLPYSEYDGVQVISTQYNAIKEYIAAGSFECIYINSNSKEVYKKLSDYKGKIVTL